MRITAFVGPSGTGKSYRAITVARQNGIEAIIDDGLLIADNRIIAGTSAKAEPTRLASVRRALFIDPVHKDSVKKAIKESSFTSIMILGTSEAMVKKIADTLGLGEISKFFYIEDFSSPEEIALARHLRIDEGQHVIPVPTFRIKKYFSGYFLHPFRLLQKNLDEKVYTDEKSIVRPTFSYMGQYTISDNVIINIAIHEAQNVMHVVKIHMINSRQSAHGAHLDMTISIEYGCNIQEVCKNVQRRVAKYLQKYTSINVRKVNIYVKSLVI